MEKTFLGISWKGNPLLGVTASWQSWYVITLTVVLFGLELLGLQFKKTTEKTG